jgi:hypothetical protein
VTRGEVDATSRGLEFASSERSASSLRTELAELAEPDTPIPEGEGSGSGPWPHDRIWTVDGLIAALEIAPVAVDRVARRRLVVAVRALGVSIDLALDGTLTMETP